MMFLLRYRIDTDHGNGPGTDTTLELCKDEEELAYELGEIQKKLAQDRHYYDHHYAPGSPYRPKTYKPCIRGIHIYRLEEDLLPYMELTQDVYDAEYQRLEAQRTGSVARAKAQRRAQYEALRAEFEEGS